MLSFNFRTVLLWTPKLSYTSLCFFQFFSTTINLIFHLGLWIVYFLSTNDEKIFKSFHFILNKVLAKREINLIMVLCLYFAVEFDQCNLAKDFMAINMENVDLSNNANLPGLVLQSWRDVMGGQCSTKQSQRRQV